MKARTFVEGNLIFRSVDLSRNERDRKKFRISPSCEQR
jgi:hypothetical protein